MGLFSVPGYNVFTCTWLPINSILFQCANFWLFVLYVGDFIPFSSLFQQFLYLRCVLAASACFFTVWAVWILCSPDTALWNLLFFIYNVVRLVLLIYKERKGPPKPSFEKLYSVSYSPIGFPLPTYNSMIESGEVWMLKDGQKLPEAVFTKGKIAQVISGRIRGELRNGGSFSFKDGDIINHESWNFTSRHPIFSPLINSYTVESESVVISWSYSELMSELGRPERRLFSSLLLGQLNSLLLHLTATLDPTIVILHQKDSPPPEETSDEGSVNMIKIKNNGEIMRNGSVGGGGMGGDANYRDTEWTGLLVEAESNV